MKTILLSFFFFVASCVYGQNNKVADTSKAAVKIDTVKHVAKLDTINRDLGNADQQLKDIKAKKIRLHSDSIGSDSVVSQPIKSSKVDTVMQNKYGDLLRDDSAYNKRYSLWLPFVEVCGDNLALSLIDSRLLKLQFSMVNITSWKRTVTAGFPWGPGWEWDQDRFGNNFLSHPIMGNFYYNDARCNGYNFWQSAPFALVGSYMWKTFGENGTPEREDIVNTTIDGILLGEVLYRISSNVLDDRTTGSERVFREILAGIIDPMRGVNRLIQGKTFRVTNKEVYQKEPLNITLYAGIHAINDRSNAILSGTTSEMLNIQFDYGNPFEERTRNPFDFFKLKVETDIGVGRKIIDNVTGYGFLFGKNAQIGNVALLEGGFLYYDYWDNTTFELSTIAIGGGVFSKLPISKTSNLYTSAHVGLIPLAGNSTGPITDTSQFRDYSFGYGWEGKVEAGLSLGNFATLGLTYYYYMIHLFNNTGRGELQTGTLGNNSIGIFKPKITIQVYKAMSVGFEYYLYSQVHTENGYPTYTVAQTEQKIFIQFYFQDPQRRGHYN